ncbi:MAG: TMEM165/GDT1 family protein [Actinomycetota bacterium]
MLSAFLVAFGVIFVAEVGDKSQLMALAFATRYRALPVLVAITLSTATIHLVSVLVGGAVGAALPHDAIAVIGGIAFIGFGLWTLRGDDDGESEGERTTLPGRSIVISVATVFFLSEFGAKTMLASVTLATENGLVGTWLGATAGMVTADAIAIWVGTSMGSRLPERGIRIASAAAFFAFGGWMILDAIF